MQGFDAKSCAGFWCKKLCMVLVEKAVQNFGVNNFAGFWYKELRRVLMLKDVQSFSAKKAWQVFVPVRSVLV